MTDQHCSSTGALPSKDWIESQVSEFSAVRLKLERHRACLALGKSGETQEIATSSSSTPKLQNEKGWASFCFGAPFWKRVCAAREDSDSESKPSKRSKVLSSKGSGDLLGLVTRFFKLYKRALTYGHSKPPSTDGYLIFAVVSPMLLQFHGKADELQKKSS